MKPLKFYSGADLPTANPRDFDTVYVYRRGVIEFIGTRDDHEQFVSMNPGSKDWTTEYVRDEDALKEARQKYQKARAERTAQFLSDLSQETGLTIANVSKILSLGNDLGLDPEQKVDLVEGFSKILQS